MRCSFAVVVSMLLLACGGAAPEPAASSQQAVAGGVSFDVPWEATFPMPNGSRFISPPCAGDRFEYVGTFRGVDHVVMAPGRDPVHANWDMQWDPPEWISLATGDTWVIAQGSMSKGSWQTTESGPAVAALHERMLWVNTRTGEKIVTMNRVHLVTNALGEVKVDSAEFDCMKK